jgi:hypothetical protein
MRDVNVASRIHYIFHGTEGTAYTLLHISLYYRVVERSCIFRPPFIDFAPVVERIKKK